MESSEAIQALKLFNEKADKLESLSFVKKLFNHASGCTISFTRVDEKKFKVKQNRTGPSEESIDAFVLTIRFFIQDNESISLRNISEIYSKIEIKQHHKNNFEQIRTGLNKFLDSNSGIEININNESLNHRRILHMIIYGSLSHVNPEKKKLYDSLSSTPLKSMVDNQFVYSLGIMFNAISAVRNINNNVINILENQQII